MGNSASSQAEPAAASAPTGFGVRVSPGLINATTEHSRGEVPQAVPAGTQETNELVQSAFQQGAEYAMQQYAQQEQAQREDALEAKKRANAQQERDLRARIEALQKREYRAPLMPMSCKEQRQSVLICYQTVRGAPPGEVVNKCQTVVDDLEKCATLVREAALANIAK